MARIPARHGVVKACQGYFHILMTPWILLGMAVLLAAASLKMWLDFGQRQRQLRAEMQRLRGLVDSNTQRMAAIRDRTSDLASETKTLISRREELHVRVLLERDRLTELEERLERVRPKSH